MFLVTLNTLGMILLQETISFDIKGMLHNMGWLALGVVILLAIMSAWSIGVMIDRFLYFSSARRQSREFAPTVAGCLREGKIEEAIGVAE
jgi:biopolymer transport protein ExbB/biopolymer transport protein TolQ